MVRVSRDQREIVGIGELVDRLAGAFNRFADDLLLGGEHRPALRQLGGGFRGGQMVLHVGFRFGQDRAGLRLRVLRRLRGDLPGLLLRLCDDRVRGLLRLVPNLLYNFF